MFFCGTFSSHEATLTSPLKAGVSVSPFKAGSVCLTARVDTPERFWFKVHTLWPKEHTILFNPSA